MLWRQFSTSPINALTVDPCPEHDFEAEAVDQPDGVVVTCRLPGRSERVDIGPIAYDLLE